MFRPWILALPIIGWVAPVSAQLTPDQRYARENTPSGLTVSRLIDSWERRSLDGDVTVYSGPAAYDARRQTDLRLRGDRSRLLAPGGRLATGATQGGYVPTVAALRDHWFAVGQRVGTPTSLRRAPVGQVDVRAEIPLALTLASPIGAPGRPLMIRAAVGTPGTPDGWSRMGEVTPDDNGNYRVEIPALHAGTYALQIDVYDPDVPELPFSSSNSTLIAWVP